MRKTLTYKTRADLMTHPAFAGLETDTSGNPCVWHNEYADEEGNQWQNNWSCQCDDEGVEPHASNWNPICDKWHEDGSPADEAYLLWESLPEVGEPLDAAQRHQREQEALTGSENQLFNQRELATVLAALRFWQRRCDPRDPEMEIATDGDIEALSDSEIDTLCERINV